MTSSRPLFRAQTAVAVLTITAACAAGYLLRRYFYFLQAENGAPLFSLEGAMLMRCIIQAATGAGIPDHDPYLNHPEGIVPVQVFSLWAEIFYARLFLRLTPLFGATTPVDFVRAAVPACFMLSVPAVYLAVKSGWQKNTPALAAALFYAVSLASTIRSTGIEISDENAGLPLVFLHVAAVFSFFRSPTRVKALSAGLLLGAGLAVWDLNQLYLAVFALFLLGAAFFPKIFDSERTAQLAALQGLCALGVCSISDYCAFHSVPSSAGFILLAAASCAALARRKGLMQAAAAAALTVAGFELLRWFLPSDSGSFSQAYGHFWPLLKAKLAHLNIRPEAPAAMPFWARMLWTPALHSASPAAALALFGRLFLPAVFALLSLASGRRSTDKEKTQGIADWYVCVFTGVFALLFALFFRLHVFLAFFATLWLGRFLARMEAREDGARIPAVLALLTLAALMDGVGLPAPAVWATAACALLIPLFPRDRLRTKRAALTAAAAACLILAEAFYSLQHAGDWGRYGYEAETRRLLLWTAQNTSPDSAVLCHFGLAPSVVLYTGRRTVLHPKFESADIRNKVAQYAAALFSENEEDFYRFCIRNDVQYYIHSRGTWSDTSPYSWRYICNAISDAQAQRSNCFKFEIKPDLLKCFSLVYSSGKYSVFRVLSGDSVSGKGPKQPAATPPAGEGL